MEAISEIIIGFNLARLNTVSIAVMVLVCKLGAQRLFVMGDANPLCLTM